MYHAFKKIAEAKNLSLIKGFCRYTGEVGGKISYGDSPDAQPARYSVP